MHPVLFFILMSVVAVMVFALFFLLPIYQKRRMEEDLLLPSRIELYREANVCLEFYRSSQDPDEQRKALRIMVRCTECDSRLIAGFPVTVRRDGQWLIRSRPLRGKVKCCRCKNTFIAGTEPCYLMESPPTFERAGNPPEGNASSSSEPVS